MSAQKRFVRGGKYRRAAGILNVFLLTAVFLMLFLREGVPRLQVIEAAEKEYLPAEARITAFRWVPTVQGRAVERLVVGTKTVIPVEVEIEGKTSEIIFMIPSKFRAFGIRMDKEVNEVKAGKAGSTVMFNIPEGVPLGRHNLVIDILEQKSRTLIGRGTIPFIFLPSDIECLC